MGKNKKKNNKKTNTHNNYNNNDDISLTTTASSLSETSFLSSDAMTLNNNSLYDLSSSAATLTNSNSRVPLQQQLVSASNNQEEEDVMVDSLSSSMKSVTFDLSKNEFTTYRIKGSPEEVQESKKQRRNPSFSSIEELLAARPSKSALRSSKENICNNKDNISSDTKTNGKEPQDHYMEKVVDDIDNQHEKMMLLDFNHETDDSKMNGQSSSLKQSQQQQHNSDMNSYSSNSASSSNTADLASNSNSSTNINGASDGTKKKKKKKNKKGASASSENIKTKKGKGERTNNNDDDDNEFLMDGSQDDIDVSEIDLSTPKMPKKSNKKKHLLQTKANPNSATKATPSSADANGISAALNGNGLTQKQKLEMFMKYKEQVQAQAILEQLKKSYFESQSGVQHHVPDLESVQKKPNIMNGRTSPTNVLPSSPSSSSPNILLQPIMNKIPKVDFYQTNEQVVITIFIKRIRDENLKMYHSKNTILLAFYVKPNLALIKISLPEDIVPQATLIEISPIKVEIKGKKSIPNVKWPSLGPLQTKMKTMESLDFQNERALQCLFDALQEEQITEEENNNETETARLVPKYQNGLDLAMIPERQQNGVTSKKVDEEKEEDDDAEEQTMMKAVPKKKSAYVGLDNTGTICYLNTIVQCLASVPELIDFLGEETSLENVNENALFASCKGDLVRSFASLVLELRIGRVSFVPRAILKLFRKYSTPFDDYEQHDAQEFLNWMLDNIHEELNVVKKKPYIELPDYDETSSNEIGANFYWDAHLKRDKSIIVDLFHGQYKSKTTCRECYKSLLKYEPFMNLTVEVPNLPVSISIIVIFPDLTKKRIHLSLPTTTSIKRIKEIIKVKFNVEMFEPVPCIISDSNIQRILPEADLITSLASYAENICFYLLEPLKAYLHITHFEDFDADNDNEEKEGKKSQLERDGQPKVNGAPNHLNGNYCRDSNVFGIPMVLSIDPGVYSKDDLYKLILKRMKSVVNGDIDTVLSLGIKIFDISKNINNQPDEEYTESQLDAGNYASVGLMWKRRVFRDRYYNMDADERLIDVNEAPQELPKAVSIYDCFDLHCKEEDVDEYYCSTCKKMVNGIKKLDLWKLPDIMIVHLKRFVQHPRFMNWVKRNIDVEYPIDNLDMSKYVVGPDAEKARYELFSVGNHIGTLSSGHYYAYCKRDDGEWYEFDDESVNALKQSDVLRPREAYLLFYKRIK